VETGSTFEWGRGGKTVKFSESIGRACAAFVLLCAGGAGLATMPAAQASTPSLMWRDLRAVGVQCLVQTSSRLNTKALEAALCERILAIAAEGAPVPLKRVNPGDPAILAAGTVTLLVHASVEPAGDRLALSFAIRPIRPSSPGSEVYFGTAPRTAGLAGAADPGSSLDSPLISALAELLPWKLQRPEIRVLTEIHQSPTKQ
jgi:hypothetical protein